MTGTWTAPLACTSRTPTCVAAAEPGTLQLVSAPTVVACKSAAATAVAVAVGSVGADVVAGGRVWRDERCGRSWTRPR